MGDRLTEFFRETGELPAVFGQRDCAFWACDWVARVRGIDPGAHLRGAYSTKSGCARFLARRGGVLAVVTGAFAAAGLTTTDAPLRGDVGCLRTPYGDAVMIRAADHWAWKSDNFITFVPAELPFLRAWTV